MHFTHKSFESESLTKIRRPTRDDDSLLMDCSLATEHNANGRGCMSIAVPSSHSKINRRLYFCSLSNNKFWIKLLTIRELIDGPTLRQRLSFFLHFVHFERKEHSSYWNLFSLACQTTTHLKPQDAVSSKGTLHISCPIQCCLQNVVTSRSKF